METHREPVIMQEEDLKEAEAVIEEDQIAAVAAKTIYNNTSVIMYLKIILKGIVHFK